MRRAIFAMVLTALAQSTGAHADGSPPWTSRAKRIIARIHVPQRDDTPQQDGIGFFVGSRGQTGYLVTAGHVIWPAGLPQSEESVKLDLSLPGCGASVPAVADSAHAFAPAGSPRARDELDLALVKIELADIPKDIGTRCQDVLAHLDELPRHIIDPEGDSLPENTPAWLIAPGILFEGRDVRPITFKKHLGNVLQFSEPFTPGDSGSPIFSDRGYILGMAIKDSGQAMKFSVILAKLDKDWETPTNLTGSYARLFFSDQYRGKSLWIDDAPDLALQLPHPAPLGKVALKLRIDDTQEVTDTVNVAGTDMNCEVATSRWLARHRGAGVYTTLVFVAATGVAFAVAKTSQHSFDQSPSMTSYDHVRLFNAIAVGTGSAGLASLGATIAGYLSSDRTGITCQGGSP